MKKILTLMILLFCWGFLAGQRYHVGDVYVAPDGSKGIVFYLHPDGSGGWVVALNDFHVGYGSPWGTIQDVPGLPNLNPTAAQQVQTDTAGYANTLAMRTFNSSTIYAAGKVDFAHGWYLPSLGQLSILFAQRPFIEASLINAGGTGIWSQECRYWSSSEKDHEWAWTVGFSPLTPSGEIVAISKNTNHKLRAVRSFTYDMHYVWNTGSHEPAITVAPTENTDYSVTVTSPFGCSGTAGASVVMRGPETHTVYDTICRAVAYQGYGFNFSTTETDTVGTLVFEQIENSNCEDTTVLHLTILPALYTDLYDEACIEFLWLDSTYTESGEHSHVFTSVSGCDSTVTLHLTLHYPQSSTLSATVLENDLPYQLNGFSYDSAGTHIQHLTTTAGCDSTLTLILTVLENVEVPADSSVCETALPLVWNGISFNGPDTQSATLTAQNGVDSTVVMTVTVLPTTYDTLSVTVIDNYLPYELNGFTYDTAGIYTQHQTNVAGCDSVITIEIQVLTATLPDNVDSADCVFLPEGTAWGIGSPLISGTTASMCAAVPLVGDIDDDGQQEIVLHTDNKVLVFNPDATLKSQFSICQSRQEGQIAIAKIQYQPEVYKTVIVAFSTGNRKFYAYDAAGNQLWQSSQAFSSYNGETYNMPAISFADFNHDGWAEMFAGGEIFDAATGVFLGKTNGNKGYAGRTWETNYGTYQSSAADLYGDADLELVVGNAVYCVDLQSRTDATQNHIFPVRSVPASNMLMSDGTAIPYVDGNTFVADINLDGKSDVLVMSVDQTNRVVYLYVWDVATQSILCSKKVTNARKFGMPQIGDLDSDGAPEICFITGTYNNHAPGNNETIYALKYNAQNPNGELDVLWTTSHSDFSGATSLTLFDFNQDGYAELVYRDENHLRIINGSLHHHETGAPVAQPYDIATYPCGSGTALEYPVVCDVDQDGAAEIVVASSCLTNSHNGRLYIFKSSTTPWAPARKVWNQYMYNVTNVNEDLTVPLYLFNNAAVFTDPQRVERRPFNNFLQQATSIDQYGRPFYAVPDVAVASSASSQVLEPDSVSFTISYCNIGDNTLNAPYPITLFVNSYGGDTLCTVTMNDDLPVDSCRELTIHLPISVLCGQTALYNLLAAVNCGGNGIAQNGGLQPECDTTNNTVSVPNPLQIDTTWQTVSACDFYLWYGDTLTLSDIYWHHDSDMNGCDSVVAIQLTVNQSTFATLHEVLIENELPYTLNGCTYDSAGTYVQHWTNVAGCDSTLTLELLVFENVQTIVDSSVCDSQLPLVWNGVTFNGTATLDATLTTENGADSVVVMNVTVLATTFGDYTATVLQNDLPYELNGYSYSDTGTYVQQLVNVNGCDSMLTVHLNVLYNAQTQADSAVCYESLPLMWNGQIFLAPGTQSAVLTGASGVDSTVVMTVTLLPSPVVAIIGAEFMCADSSVTLSVDSFASYHWSTGATTQSILVTEEGTYTVTVTNGYGCMEVAEHSVSLTEMDAVAAINTFEMCPGGSYTMTVGYETNATIQLAHGTSTLALSDTIFLPDGVSCPPYGCSYRSPLTFTDFAPGSTIQNVNDILYVRLNMEHSWIGDLYINITCPNGQKADILKYGGSGESSCDQMVPVSSIGWQSGNNMFVDTYLGIAYDYEGYNDCDASDPDNAPGIGWNYCWSNNTTQGYTYAPGAGSLIYRAEHEHNYIVDSSDVAAGTQFYHPDQSFVNLLGCPLNGSWYIEVVDAWSGDNGYIFTWELALNPSLLPASGNPVTMVEVDGPWLQPQTDTTFTINPPDTLTHDTVVTYIVHLYDDYGCHYDTSITLPVYIPTWQFVDTTVLQNALPFELNGYSYSDTGTYVQMLTNVHGCDSTLTVHLTVLNNVQNMADSTICPESLPLVWNGKTFTAEGTQSAVLTAANGADSTVVMTVSIYPQAQAAILGSEFLCADSSVVLTACSAASYLWSTGATTQSITVSQEGTYTLTVTNAYGCVDTAAHVLSISDIDPVVAINTFEMCAGGSYTMTVGYENTSTIQLAHGTSTLALSETIFLPDGVSCPPYGCSYRSPLTFTDFAPGSTIQNVNDILYVRLNMEHSYIGDLYINITCPNNQRAHILRYGGTGTSNCNNSVPNGGVGWQSGSNMGTWTYLGDAYDYEGYNDCDANDPDNAPGIGWNYCWSNNTTQGYTYAPGAGSLIYRSVNEHNDSADSSNVAAGTQFYHPDQSFASLIGCPLNGSWYIEVVDAWSGDNGYIFGWELALDPSLLPVSSNPVTMAVVDGPWLQPQTDTTFTINPPDTLTHDTVVTYIVHLYDDYGCHYDTSITLPVFLPTWQFIDTTVLQNNLPLVLNGLSYSDTGTYVQALTNVHGCDSTLTVHLTVLNNVQTAADSTVCPESLPLVWNGKTFTAEGTQSAVLTAANGTDSTVVMTVSIHPQAQAAILGSEFLCADSSVVLTADSAASYLWSTGATTQSITVSQVGIYTVTITDSNGCVAYDNHNVSLTDIDAVTAINTFEMCAGDSYMMTVGYENNSTIQLAHGTSTLALAETIFLPDGVSCPPYGCSYRSPLTFSDFAPGSTIQDVNDILYVRLNMEHSYIGDLYINITCPNNQRAHILRYGGTGTSSCNNSVPSGGVGWQSGSNMYKWTYLGNAYDYEGYNDCNANDPGNAPGVGWNYCWSNNTTQGYVYAPGAGSLIYRSVNAHNGIVDSSNVVAGTKFYHPDQSFANLIGCPLNGSWYIEVVDAWTGDNGYIFGWELALDPSLLPVSSNPVTMAVVDGPWVHAETDTTFTINPPVTLAHDTVVTYIVHFYDDYGCTYDTSITLPVYVPTSQFIDTTVLQNNLPLVVNGLSYSDTGTYVQPLTNVHGCDSTLTIHLNILYNVQTLADSAVCLEAFPLVWNGKTFTAVGTQNAVLTAANGVDSTVVMTVSLLPSSTNTITATVVQNNLPYTLNGTSYNTTGVYTQHLTNALGCDSLLTLNLTVYQNVSATIDTTVCAANLPYTWHGLTFAATGTQSVVLTAHTGADSTLYCHLIVDAPSATIGNVTHVLCYGDSTGAASVNATGGQTPYTYQWANAAGTTVSASNAIANQPAGAYNVTVTDQVGCTSTTSVTLNTESGPLQPGTIAANQDVCIDGDIATFTGTVASGGDNGAYQWQLSTNGTVWNPAPGTNNGQNYTYPNAASESFSLRRAWISQTCGSVYSDTVTVTVWLSFEDTVTAVVCQNEPYQGQGFDIDASETADPGVYFFENLLTTGHCDSLVVLILTVNPTYDINLEDEVCEGSPYSAYGFNVPHTETTDVSHLQRTLNLQTVNGCDSIVQLDLTVIDTALEIISSTMDFCEELYTELTAVTSMTNYLWNTGAHTQQITATHSGTYTVVASQGACMVTAQYMIESCDVVLYLPNAITPSNGDGLNDYFCIPERTRLLIDEFEIAIYNRWGELVYFSTDKNFQWNGEVRGKIYYNNIYNYVLRCTNASGRPYLYKGSIVVL